MAKRIVTKKQESILTLLYSFRFINSKQVQAFLNHKDHRRSNAWLKDLVTKGYLERDFIPRFGTSTKPAVFFLAQTGRAYIRNMFHDTNRKYLGRLRDDKKRSKGFRIKCQLIADCYLLLFPDDERAKFVKELNERVRGGVELKYNHLQFFTSAYYHELEFVLLPKLKPDAYVYKRISKGIVHTCIYTLDAYFPRMMLRYMLTNIFTTLEEEYWEDESIASLQFYFVCPNHMIIVYLRRLLTSFFERYSGQEIIFHFATRNQLYKRQQDKTKPTGWIDVSSNDYE